MNFQFYFLDLTTILQRYDCLDELTEKEDLFLNLQLGEKFLTTHVPC